MPSTNPTDPFIGAWELVAGSWVNEDGSAITYEEAGLKSLKILSDHKFTFITSSKGSFYAAGGGEYLVENGAYTEIPSQASHSEMIGQHYKFNYQLEGDTWTNSRWKEDVRVEF